MTITYVEDGELLYRAIRANSDEYTVDDGRLRFTANAFKDPDCRPSVDRSSIRREPCDTRFRPSDGVALLVTGEVRAIATVAVSSPDGKAKTTYRVDVQHRPISESDAGCRENLAHCQIECDPEIKKNHYKRLKEALAFLATKSGWVVGPEHHDGRLPN